MTDTATEALLPCPFCGATDTEVRDLEDASTPDARFVQCDCCEALGPVSRVDAIAAWNRRTPPTPATEEREAVAQWCSGCHEVRSVDCYRAGCPKSDTERRAAEILAAEANVTARIVAFYRANGAGSWDTFEAFARAIERNEHGAGK